MDNLTILLAEDDHGHARLIRRNLRRAGLSNEILHFDNGKDILAFLFKEETGAVREEDKSYILLLDINMPGIDGIEVLTRIKGHKELKSLPVIILTTTDNPIEIRRCHELGCNSYIIKPIDYERFSEVLNGLGIYLKIIEIPGLERRKESVN